MPRLRLKTKLVLAISGMVFALVVGLSWVYVTQLVRQRLAQSYEGADFVSHQILHGVRQALEVELNAAKINTADPQKLHDAIELPAAIHRRVFTDHLRRRHRRYRRPCDGTHGCRGTRQISAKPHRLCRS